MRKCLTIIAVCGLVASLLGFAVAYWAISRFEPRLYHYLLASLGFISTLYGFYQAFRAIRTGQMSVERPQLALGFISAGLVSMLYGFWQAYRGLLMIHAAWIRVMSICLVTIALLAALFGLWRRYQSIVRELRS